MSHFCPFVLQQFSDKHPESASSIKLTMAQLYLVQGNKQFTSQVTASLWDDLSNLNIIVSLLQKKKNIFALSDFCCDVFSASTWQSFLYMN